MRSKVKLEKENAASLSHVNWVWKKKTGPSPVIALPRQWRSVHVSVVRPGT